MKKYIYGGVLLLISVSAIANGGDGLDQLMPQPKSVVRYEGKFRLENNFSVGISDHSNQRICDAATRFVERMTNKTGLFVKQGIISVADNSTEATFQINIEREGKVELGEDESYVIELNSEKVTLNAKTDIGAMRGLQTLFQMISTDDQGYYWPAAKIEDAPRFPWRGLMIDVSRHFQPVDVIKRNIDGMAAVKLNVLHLHICDDHGYRIESKVYPKLHEVASDGQYYTFEQVRDIVKYANDRGVRVMPEIDVPGHATAIVTAYPELGSKDTTYSLIRNAGIFDATLNPIRENTYVFLDELFAEVSALFPDKYFHIGGDENEGKHWNENSAIQEFKTANNIENNHQLQAYFNNRLFKILQKYDKEMMGWEEVQSPDIPKSTIIHSWRGANEGAEPGESLFSAAEQGFKTVLSNGYYIDLMYKGSSHYLTDPHFGKSNISKEIEDKILGGEATMWSELVTPLTIDSRIWPRMAAIAERYWSPVSVNDVRSMYERLEMVSLSLEHYGLRHISGKEVILRNLAGSSRVGPVRNLVNVIEPMKGYSRNPGGTMYNVFDPYTKLADATTADAADALKFTYLVDDFEVSRDTRSQELIENYLSVWQDNDDYLKANAKTSPILNQALPHSANLKVVATLGKEALHYYSIGKKPSKKWYKSALKELETAKAEQSGRTELQVVEPIAKLIELSMQSKGNQ